MIKLSRYRQADLQDFEKSNRGYPNGADNNFDEYLDGLFNVSVTHQGIINDLVSYIVGQGLKTDNPQDLPLIKKFFNKRFLNKVVRGDLIHNSKPIEVLKDGTYQLKELNPIFSKQIRVIALAKNKPVEFEFRRSWNRKSRDYRTKKDFIVFKPEIQEMSSLYYSYDSGTFDVPYGRPYYMSGLDSVEMEASIYLANNHAAQNGMMPSMFFDIPSTGDEQKDQKLQANIVKSMAGASSAGKAIFRFHEQGAEGQANITVPSVSNVGELFAQLYEKAEAGISKAHGLPSPTLIAGLNIKPTGFGDAEEEMQWALNQWRQKKIYPYREDFLEDLDPLFREAGIQGKVEFVDAQDDNRTVVPVEETNNILTNLTGRQLQNIQRIVRKFNKGELNHDQASAMLKKGFNFSDEEVGVWLITNSQEFSKYHDLVKLNKGAENVDLDTFIQSGEIEDLEEYELIQADHLNGKPIHYEDFSELVNLARVPSSSWASESEQDTPLFKVRYKYKGRRSNNTREFCRKMMDADKVYRFEDIEKAGTQRVNAGFGEGGAPTYSIWLYKGGARCHHFWERRVYLRRSNRHISVNEARRIILDLPIEERDDNRLPVNDPKVAQLPNDMPNNGYLNPR